MSDSRRDLLKRLSGRGALRALGSMFGGGASLAREIAAAGEASGNEEEAGLALGRERPRKGITPREPEAEEAEGGHPEEPADASPAEGVCREAEGGGEAV